MPAEVKPVDTAEIVISQPVALIVSPPGQQALPSRRCRPPLASHHAHATTTVAAHSGLRFTELLPRQAAIADRFTLVRSMAQTAAGHPAGSMQMLSGDMDTRDTPEPRPPDADRRPRSADPGAHPVGGRLTPLRGGTGPRASGILPGSEVHLVYADRLVPCGGLHVRDVLPAAHPRDPRLGRHRRHRVRRAGRADRQPRLCRSRAGGRGLRRAGGIRRGDRDRRPAGHARGAGRGRG
ncbi:MAG: DUF1501 domain-containing protein [Planctomycetia bacterium]|nr:DUF1501 domain-containing protein [Planctomycetia bacterium]